MKKYELFKSGHTFGLNAVTQVATQKCFTQGGSTPRSNPLPFYNTILTEPLLYLL